eukprot:scaffold953_cov141-Cylindrotheca_fusiformis.AAC.5
MNSSLLQPFIHSHINLRFFEQKVKVLGRCLVLEFGARVLIGSSTSSFPISWVNDVLRDSYPFRIQSFIHTSSCTSYSWNINKKDKRHLFLVADGQSSLSQSIFYSHIDLHKVFFEQGKNHGRSHFLVSDEWFMNKAFYPSFADRTIHFEPSFYQGSGRPCIKVSSSQASILALLLALSVSKPIIHSHIDLLRTFLELRH